MKLIRLYKYDWNRRTKGEPVMVNADNILFMVRDEGMTNITMSGEEILTVWETPEEISKIVDLTK